MNMRKRKLVVMTAMYYIAANAAWDRWINKLFERTEEETAEHKAAMQKQWDEVLGHFGVDSAGIRKAQANKPIVEKVWKVARVKDNVVVLETQDLGEAEEMILKAARQKKARLHLLDDKPYVFEFDEPLDQYDPKNFVHLV